MRVGEELNPNVVNRKAQSHSKALGNVSEAIGYNFKSRLIFLYEETETEKKEAKELIDKENQGRGPWNYLNFAVNTAARGQEEEKAGRKKPGPKPSVDTYQKDQRLSRGDRAAGGMD